MTSIADLINQLPSARKDVQSSLDISKHEFDSLRQEAHELGFEIKYDRSKRVYTSNIKQESASVDLESNVKEYLAQQGMSPQEASQLIKGIESGRPINHRKTRIPFEESRVKYGVISDTHMGHKMYRGDILEHAVENFRREGVELDNGLTIRLRHPGGGTAYAISYKMQKYLLSMDDDDKPDVVHQGHYHKLNYLFYRNIHAFDAGALQQQSIFMKKKDSPSMLAYTIVDVGVNKQGLVDRIKPEFVTFK